MPPSPNAQLYALIVPSGSLLVLVKLQASSEQLDVKFATGGRLTVTLFEVLFVAP